MSQSVASIGSSGQSRKSDENASNNIAHKIADYIYIYT